MSDYTVGLTQVEQAARDRVGGKAAGLARMIQAGIPVPPAFAVTTAAYREFIAANRLDAVVEQTMAGVDFEDAAAVEAASAVVRRRIEESEFPAAVARQIADRHRTLIQDRDGFVAVRSSGTAEDMGDASFAGLYDSYLDIRGVENVLDAVRRCWASLWTARCAAYRHRLDIPQAEAEVGVVVQEMVAAHCAGVLFTANPMNARTDEVVVNANWGLGESIASGIATPDEYVLDGGTGAVKRRTCGPKLIKIVRDPEGRGTCEVATTAQEQSSWVLDKVQLGELVVIARRVVELAGGLPQDVEWASRQGEFLILQSRDVTGVEFTWDEDLESWQPAPADDETVWNNSYAQQYWNGAITPLFYSIRARELWNVDQRLFALWGFDDLLGVRRLKFFGSTVYGNSDLDRRYQQYVLPRRLRGGSVASLPSEWREDALRDPFDPIKHLRMLARIRLLTSDHGPLRGIRSVYEFADQKRRDEAWPTADELARYTDAELRREFAAKSALYTDWVTKVRPTFHVYGATVLALLRDLLTTWYTGGNDHAFEDLISGLPKRTALLQEQIELWELAQLVRGSRELRGSLDSCRGAEFFDRAAEVEGGAEFRAAYREFVAEHGYRGHQDRDIWFARRCEDPSLDVSSLRALLDSAGPSPVEVEHRIIAKRESTTKEVEENLRALPFGDLRVELFRLLLSYIHRFLVLRDDTRPFADQLTWAKKIALAELGRRAFDRGLFEAPDDYFFVAEQEYFDVLDGRDQRPLTRAKIRARRAVFERALARETDPPQYLRGSTPLVTADDSVTEESGVFQGQGTSRGSVSGPARVVRSLSEIDRLERGDILVCSSTDPGWAPVFGKVGGLILEAGGMLSHGACLSREYGLPAVTLSGAVRKIPDGATVALDGDSGKVVVLPRSPAVAGEPASRPG